MTNMETIISNPNIPYVAPIFNSNKFSPGKLITIKGRSLEKGFKFYVNLQCGLESDSKNDIVLHMVIHLINGYISLNSLQNALWDEELRYASPIQKNEPFVINITCDSNNYKIAINDCAHFEFPQRIHYNQVTHILVAGDVSVSEIIYSYILEINKRVNFDDDVAITVVETPPIVTSSAMSAKSFKSQLSRTSNGVSSNSSMQNLYTAQLYPHSKNLTQVNPIKRSTLQNYCRYFGIIFGAIVIIGIIVVIKFSKRWMK